MADPTFFAAARGLTVGEIGAAIGTHLAVGIDANKVITGVAPLDRAGPGDLSFIDNANYEADLALTHAGACLASRRFVARVPARVIAIESAAVHRDFARITRLLFPGALRAGSVCGSAG